MITFDELCAQLNLSTGLTSKKQFLDLKKWCNAEISQDCHFKGTEEHQYEAYMKLAREYLTVFLPAATNLTQLHPSLNQLSAVQYAAFHGYDRFIEKMNPEHDKEALDMVNAAGMTLFHLAALGGHVHTIQALLSKGAQPDRINRNEQFPLYSALVLPMLFDEELKKQKIDVFYILYQEIPALINAVDASGDNVVHLMASNGFDVLIKQLVDGMSPAVFQENHFHKLPIHVAILNQQLEATSALLKMKGMSRVTDAEKRTPLHYAAKYDTSTKLVEACLNSDGVEINALDSAGNTSALVAAQNGNLPALQLLVKKGANTELADYQGSTLLHLAVKNHRLDMATWIFDNLKPDVNALDSQGHPPLYYAQNANELDDRNGSLVHLLQDRGGSNLVGKIQPS